jgi:hypothetical protein
MMENTLFAQVRAIDHKLHSSSRYKRASFKKISSEVDSINGEFTKLDQEVADHLLEPYFPGWSQVKMKFSSF